MEKRLTTSESGSAELIYLKKFMMLRQLQPSCVKNDPKPVQVSPAVGKIRSKNSRCPSVYLFV